MQRTLSQPSQFGTPSATLAITGVLSVVAGLALPIAPEIAFFPLAVLVAALLIAHAPSRLALVIGGGLLTLQSSSHLDTMKIAYLGMTLVATLGAWWGVARRREDIPVGTMQILVRASLLSYAVVVVSLPTTLMNGGSAVAWLRDVSAYLLFASVPIFAMDAALALSETTITSAFITVGLVATVSFAVSWIQRRGLATLPVAHVAFPSFLLGAALFCFACAKFISGRSRRSLWAGAASVVFLLLIVTGTRSTLVLLVAPVALVVLGRRDRLNRLVRSIVFVPIAAIAIGLAAMIITRVAALDQASLLGRLTSVRTILRSPSSDQSYGERLAQAHAAFRAFEAHPLFGLGPGIPISWHSAFGFSGSSYNLDTALSLPAKFGILGVVLLLAVASSYVVVTRRLASFGGRSVAQSGLVAYGLTVAVWLTLGSPFEDKGFSFGLIFVLAAAIAEKMSDRRELEGR